MKGQRYVAAPGRRRGRGRTRVALVGVGLIAAMSLVWQQQATLASFIDSEFAGATFTAAKLPVITPTTAANAASIVVKWDPATRFDGTDYRETPSYTVNWSPDGSGAGTDLDAVTGVKTTHAEGTGTQTDANQNFTDVSAGATHACGIARGSVYCWGTSATGALGGATSPTNTPSAVGGLLAGKIATDVSAGTNLSCAIADGDAYCWGSGNKGQLGNNGTGNSSTPVAVSGLTAGKVTAISAGGTHACAVADGLAYCWGLNTYGQLGEATNGDHLVATAVSVTGVLKGRTVGRISAGISHTCAVADGRAFCWGLATNGRLGNNNSTTNSNVPVLVTPTGLLNTRTVSAISAGGSHSCAIADGKAYCWGLGSSGQMGNTMNTTTNPNPVPVTATTMTGTVTAVSAGSAHTCAIASPSGGVYCWGAGASYGLGNSATGNLTAPVQLAGNLAGRSSTTISAGTSFGCASGNSPASCWGLGTGGQMGDGSPLTNQTPATVALTDKACPDGSVRISSSACSLMQGTPFSYRLSYKVGSWVADQSGWVAATTKSRGGVTPTADGTPGRKALGIKWDEASDAVNAYQEYTVERSTRSDHGDAVTIAVTGARTAVDRGGVAPTKSFTEVTSGFAHTCAILSGQLYCWGANGNGQLGLNDKVPRSEPTVVPTFADKTVTAVSAGAYHTCAIADDLSYCWGLNGDGQVGDGTTGTDRTVPVLLSTVVATGISAGAYHSCGIATGNAVYCWGRGTSGQLGNGASGSSSNPVGAVGALAGKTITAVTAGTYHSCAITSVGLAYCWGEGLNGKLGTGNVNNATSPVAVVSTGALNGKSISRISAGEQHTCAIANALAYCWGSDASGQLGNGAGGSSSSPAAVSTAGVLTGVTALSVGRLHSCAVATGKTYCWGEAGSYQLGNASATDQQTPVSPTLAGTSLPNATATDVGGGWSHTCTIADGDLYCWGLGTSGQLGNATSTTSTSPAASISKARCGPATSFGDGTCSLAPGVKYYYRVTYTLDGNTSATGSWNDVTTSP